MDKAGLIDTVALNTWPTLALIQAALAGGLADGGGSVVNISSGSPHKTTSSMVAYAAAKAALNALTRTIAADLGPRGVRVNAVSPGLTKTSGTKAMWENDGGRRPAPSWSWAD
jgi:3-oxoacyl-[acyl-carrier protein] reductase